jgi:hypothetical protein
MGTRTVDLDDPTVIDAKAVGAHVDVTYGSGPYMVNRRMPEEDKAEWLRPGYRYKIVK